LLASIQYKNGLSITPNVNLVSNIGFGNKAAHCVDINSQFSKMPVMELSHIIHPKQVIIDIEADKFTYYNLFEYKYNNFFLSWVKILYYIFKYIFKKINLKSKKLFSTFIN
jgi:hypothetical protein